MVSCTPEWAWQKWKEWGFRLTSCTYRLNWVIRTSWRCKMNEMTLPSRHRLWNSNPGGLRPSSPLLGHRVSPQYWIFTCEQRKKNWMPEQGSKPRSLTFHFQITIICFSIKVMDPRDESTDRSHHSLNIQRSEKTAYTSINFLRFGGGDVYVYHGLDICVEFRKTTSPNILFKYVTPCFNVMPTLVNAGPKLRRHINFWESHTRDPHPVLV